MPSVAPAHHSSTPASLDALYQLIRNDLQAVDTLILGRVNQEIPLIHGIAQHLINSGGKRIRPALTLIASQACNYPDKQHIALAAAVEFIHTATLLHDDVVDESKLRRGLATANELFGNKASILVGDFLLSQAFQLMTASGSLRVLKILSDAAAVISRGEVLQLMAEGDLSCTVEQYLEVISSKTAVLFAAACELGPVIAGKAELEKAFRDFGQYMGIAFQLVDDILDYTANQTTLGKALGDDFREGKITLPVIYAYQAASDDEKSFWQRTMSELNQQPGDFEQAQSILATHQAIAQSNALVRHYCEQARAALDPLGNSAAKSAMLDIVDFCESRSF
ncbi:MAG: polyprenyl synthetase family protein [Rickettsiales bacterium]|nr:polyprenyl synthetase family protein [Rickettsiales bacterium]